MSTARFDEIYRAHHAFLRRLAARLCGSTFEPDDLVQDVLERCVVHTGALLSAVNHQSWMARVMRNLFVDRLRRRNTAPCRVPLEDQLAMPAYEPPAWWEAIDGDEIRMQTSRLPQTLRAPFELFAFHGRTYQQIADELGITQLTVGTRLLRARRCLRDLLCEAHAASADGGHRDAVDVAGLAVADAADGGVVGRVVEARADRAGVGAVAAEVQPAAVG